MPGPYWCIRLPTRARKTDYTACDPEKTTTHVLHVVLTTAHTHVRLKSIGKKPRKEEKEKKKNRIKKETRRTEKTRQEDEARKGEERKKNTILADPRTD